MEKKGFLGMLLVRLPGTPVRSFATSGVVVVKVEICVGFRG